MISKEIVFEHIHLILFFGILAALSHWFSKTRGFFSLPKARFPEKLCRVQGKHVVFAFGIYLFTALFVAPTLARLFFSKKLPALETAVFLQLISVSLILVFFGLFTRMEGSLLFQRIWIGEQEKPRLLRDFALGLVFWFIAFPAVVVVGECADLLIYLFFRVESYEQVAVHFLKTTLGSPLLLSLALFTIMVLAPLIEEWLFRGFLQNFLRDRFGRWPSIFLSALGFALFHLSGAQGWGNLSLALSLFSFSFYIGFIYEKQGTLLAPIGLHMAFNTISSLRILLYTN